MADDCIPLEPIKIPFIKLPAGAKLQGVADFAAGIPTNCKVNLNLLIQLGPLFGAMACILKILQCLGAIVEFAKAAATLNVFKMGQKLQELISAFNDISTCIPPLAPLSFAFMIKDILELIINILTCLVDELASIVEFQASLDFAGAEGNPALLEALNCAKQSSDTSTQNLFQGMVPIQTVLGVIKSLADVASLPLPLPDLSSIGQGGDAVQAIETIRQSLHALKSAIDGLPG
jgi:hypothetical protein